MSPLEQELLDVEGVANAHVRITDRGPTGVRVVLSSGADRARVAGDIRRILDQRGLTSTVEDRLDDVDAGRSLPPPAALHRPTPPVPGPEPDPRPEPYPRPPMAPRTSPGATEGLGVTVEETADSCAVTVARGDRSARRVARRTERSVRVAALGALWELSGRTDPAPELSSVTVAEAGHRRSVTVVLIGGDVVGVGSAMIGATELLGFLEAAELAAKAIPT